MFSRQISLFAVVFVKIVNCILQALYHKLVQRQTVVKRKLFKLFHKFLGQSECLCYIFIVSLLQFKHIYTLLYINYDSYLCENIQ